MYKLRTGLFGICLVLASCKVPAIISPDDTKPAPQAFEGGGDTTTMANIQWQQFFTDKNLVSLIDTALKNNQEMLIAFQEIEIARNDVRFRQGPLLPTVGVRAGAGVEKVGRY